MGHGITAFMGREAEGQGEGLIRLIKCIGWENGLHFPTHKTKREHLGGLLAPHRPLPGGTCSLRATAVGRAVINHSETQP